MGLLFDTNVLIDYLRNISPAVKYLETLSDNVVISSLSVGELHAGARNDKEIEMLKGFVASFEVVSADASICRMGGNFRARYGPSHGIDLIDGIIAATAVSLNVALVTLNRKHFPMLNNVIVPYHKS